MLKKVKSSKQTQLIADIGEIDKQYSVSPSPHLYKERIKLQSQYNLLSTDKAEQALLRLHGYVYENGDRAGRLLARQLKAKSAAQLISQIRNFNGDVVEEPIQINKIFKEYYMTLYSLESPQDHSEMTSFLTWNLPK